MKKFTIDNLKEVIDKQFEIAGYSVKFEDIKNEDEWYMNYPTTIEKENEFTTWLEEYLKPFAWKRAKEEVGWILLNYWLKVCQK